MAFRTVNSQRPRARVATAATLAITASLTIASTAQAAVTRGVEVLAGFSGDEPPLEMAHETRQHEGPTYAAVSVHESSAGSTLTDPGATRACVRLRRATSRYTKKKRTTTTTYETDAGCGSLSLRELVTGEVAVEGTVPSDSGGAIEVDVRVIPRGAGVRVPVWWCGWPFGVPCPSGSAAVYRWGDHSGTVTSPRLGGFDIKALGGKSRVSWL